MSLDERISNLRDKLHKSISHNEDFDRIYNLSTELDKLITLYYSRMYALDV